MSHYILGYTKKNLNTKSQGSKLIINSAIKVHQSLSSNTVKWMAELVDIMKRLKTADVFSGFPDT